MRGYGVHVLKLLLAQWADEILRGVDGRVIVQVILCPETLAALLAAEFCINAARQTHLLFMLQTKMPEPRTKSHNIEYTNHTTHTKLRR